MSELLYIYGELDERVRPLVYVIRHWARQTNLIEMARPTQKFTNFSVTALAIFYLQLEHRMLPSFRQLYKLAGKDDARLCDDGVECTFLRDISGQHARLNSCHGNADPSISELLLGFFEFYAKFDFKRKAACILTGELQPKRKNGSKTVKYCIDLTNPLEPDLNVCANIEEHSVIAFQKQCQRSADLLRSMMDSRSPMSWGARVLAAIPQKSY